jgi:hypothetical protein
MSSSVGFRGGSGTGWLLGRQKIDGGIVSRSAPIFDLKQTWANTTQTFTGLRLNVTDRGSATGSLLADLQVNGTRQFSISSTGNITTFGGGIINLPGGAETDGIARVNINSASGSVSSLRLTVPGGEAKFGFIGGAGYAGTNTGAPFNLYTSGTQRIGIASTGAVTVTTGNALIADHRLTGTAPTSATATGTAGDVRYDSSFIYVCTATNTWVRSLLTTW